MIVDAWRLVATSGTDCGCHSDVSSSIGLLVCTVISSCHYHFQDKTQQGTYSTGSAMPRKLLALKAKDLSE